MSGVSGKIPLEGLSNLKLKASSETIIQPATLMYILHDHMALFILISAVSAKMLTSKTLLLLPHNTAAAFQSEPGGEYEEAMEAVSLWAWYRPCRTPGMT